MKAQDVEFVRTEALSIKTDGYARHSKLPRKTANAVIVQKLIETVDPEKPRSNYVNVLMEIGISRRSAYRLVNDAYTAKAKAATTSKQVSVATATPPSPQTATGTGGDGGEGKERAAVQPQPDTALRYIEWPDEVKKTTGQSILPRLEDIMIGIWRIGVMQHENKINKNEAQIPLKPIMRNLKIYAGEFSLTIAHKALQAGWEMQDPPFGHLASITKYPVDTPDLAGKHASVLIPPKKDIKEYLLLHPTERDKIVKQINLLVNEGDEIAIFHTDGRRERDHDGNVTRFNTLAEASEYATAVGSVTVVIHAQ